DAAALTALLASRSMSNPPPRLAARALAAALNRNTKTGAAFLIAKGAMTMMNWQKAKIVIAAVAIVLLSGAGGIVALNSALADDKPAPRPAAVQPAGARPRTALPVAT